MKLLLSQLFKGIFHFSTKHSKKIGHVWLERKHHLEIDREPFFRTFEYRKNNSRSLILTPLPRKGNLKQKSNFLPGDYPKFPQSHTVFIPLKKMGYRSIPVNQKTSLKQTVKDGKYLASEFDNMFYNAEARMISDPIPIWFEFSLN